MAVTFTPSVHSWLGLAPTASPSSGTAVKMPPAFHPPVDDEYSLRDVEPSLATRTCPRVSATARSVLGSSSWVKVGPCCRATPPYTWQSVELQVCATLNRPLPPLSSDSATAYDRAATVWARRAFMPFPPPRSPQEAGDSLGTTPRRYDSRAALLTVRGVPPSSTASRLPRSHR